MATVGQEKRLLEGERIAFTGRLASMTRSEAARLVAEHGGKVAAKLSAGVSMLVVGREGWPLDKDGRLTQKIRDARAAARRGKQLAIVPEERFLARLSIGDTDTAATRCDMAQLTAAVGVSRDRVRSWIDAGLIQPAETVSGIAYFDFAQVAGAKRLVELAGQGVSTARLRRSLRQLGDWLQTDAPLEHVAMLERRGDVLVRLADGQLSEVGGQLRMEFSSEPSSGAHSVTLGEFRSAESWFDEAFELEQNGDLATAADAYRQTLLVGGPSAECSFNLANVLYALDEKPAAAERFRQVLELDPSHCDAWNNLATVLLEMNRPDEALAAYRQALRINPACADAHYNLADALEALGRSDEALPHWSAYLQSERTGPWADYARGRVKASRA